MTDQAPEETQEYADGWDARRRGLPSTNCPHAPGTAKSRNWRHGHSALIVGGPAPWRKPTKTPPPPHRAQAVDTSPRSPVAPPAEVERGTGDAIVVEAPPLGEFRAGFKPTPQPPDPASWDAPVRRATPPAEGSPDPETARPRPPRNRPQPRSHARYTPAQRAAIARLKSRNHYRRAKGYPEIDAYVTPEGEIVLRQPDAHTAAKTARKGFNAAQRMAAARLYQRNLVRRKRGLPQILATITPDGRILDDETGADISDARNTGSAERREAAQILETQKTLESLGIPAAKADRVISGTTIEARGRILRAARVLRRIIDEAAQRKPE